MHHQGIELLAVVGEWASAEPVEKLIAIIRTQNFPERLIALFGKFDIVRKSKKMQVVIAKHGYRGVTQRLYKANCLERLWAAIARGIRFSLGRCSCSSDRSEMFDSLIQSPFLLRSLAVGLTVSVLCSVLSVYVVLRRMAFIGQGIGHAAFGGIALGLWLFPAAILEID